MVIKDPAAIAATKKRRAKSTTADIERRESPSEDGFASASPSRSQVEQMHPRPQHVPPPVPHHTLQPSIPPHKPPPQLHHHPEPQYVPPSPYAQMQYAPPPNRDYAGPPYYHDQQANNFYSHPNPQTSSPNTTLFNQTGHHQQLQPHSSQPPPQSKPQIQQHQGSSIDHGTPPSPAPSPRRRARPPSLQPSSAPTARYAYSNHTNSGYVGNGPPSSPPTPPQQPPTPGRVTLPSISQLLPSPFARGQGNSGPPTIQEEPIYYTVHTNQPQQQTHQAAHLYPGGAHVRNTSFSGNGGAYQHYTNSIPHHPQMQVVYQQSQISQPSPSMSYFTTYEHAPSSSVLYGRQGSADNSPRYVRALTKFL